MTDDLIRLSDFNSMRIVVKLQNTTTNMPVKNEPAIRMIEFLEGGLVLEIPQRSCALGHSLLLQMAATAPDGTDFEFESTTRVEGLDNYSEGGTDRVALAFLQYDEKGWARFQSTFSARQDEIERFFKAAKGY